jgi:hypothetical protein
VAVRSCSDGDVDSTITTATVDCPRDHIRIFFNDPEDERLSQLLEVAAAKRSPVAHVLTLSSASDIPPALRQEELQP